MCHPSRDECLGHVALYGWSIGWSLGASTLGSLPTNRMEFHSRSSEYIRVRHPLREAHIWLRWHVASDLVRVWVRAHILVDMWFLFMTVPLHDNHIKQHPFNHSHKLKHNSTLSPVKDHIKQHLFNHSSITPLYLQ